MRYLIDIKFNNKNEWCCLEEYYRLSALGRILLRKNDQTIAVGVVNILLIWK